jgi:uncharacterized RDD family membrane protein YckC
MTCQHCQTWISEVDHRCRHCGRRVRSTPPRISPSTYPIAATATAPAISFGLDEELAPEITARAVPEALPPIVQESGQQTLFSQASDRRIIPFDKFGPFDKFTPAQQRDSAARLTDPSRPIPIRQEKVEVKHARPQKSDSPRATQRRLEFQGEEQILSQPKHSIICDAPVAPAELRMRAAVIDMAVMGTGLALCYAMFRFAGCELSTDKHVVPFLAAALLTVPFVYKLLWAYAGNDSLGMQKVGLVLVDFDGNPPSRRRRYQRLFGSFVSLLAAAMGLVWVFVDQDALTWHDHISNTFPTFAFEE